jgi:hypothetical protein
LQLIVARKRTIPLTLNPMKSGKAKRSCGQTVGATRVSFLAGSRIVCVGWRPPRAPAHRSVRFPDGRRGL